MQQEFWKSIARLAMHQAFQKYKAPEVSIRLAPRAVIVNTCRIGCCIYACYRGHFGLRVKHFAVLLRVEQRSSGLRPRRNLDHAETPLVAHAGSGQVPDYGPQKGPRQDDHPIARREEEGDGAPQDPRHIDHRE